MIFVQVVSMKHWDNNKITEIFYHEMVTLQKVSQQFYSLKTSFYITTVKNSFNITLLALH